MRPKRLNQVHVWLGDSEKAELESLATLFRVPIAQAIRMSIASEFRRAHAFVVDNQTITKKG